MTTVRTEIRAPRGTELSCKGWVQEAAYRMIQNNLDPEVAERPEDLVVYGGIGKAARNWDSFDAILATLRRLESDETLLIQSGKPVAVFRTHGNAPRVLLANSNLVPQWATWDHFRKLDAAGLMMYGQMTAGSWIYIGTQGIVQGTYETFAECARQHFGGDLAGRLVVTAGLGGMGGAQPLAAALCGGTMLAADVDGSRIDKRIATRYLDRKIASTRDAAKDAAQLDRAIDEALAARDARQAISIGVVANAVDLLDRMLERGILPDVLTDQTSAHDETNGYVPDRMSLGEALRLREADPDRYRAEAIAAMGRHVEKMLELQRRGAVTFDYGNNIRAQAVKAGVPNAFDFQGFVPLFIRPLFCEGKGPFRWVALSGDPADIEATDRALLEAFPENTGMVRWLEKAKERIAFQGLPARICWLGYGERAKAGRIFNDLVASGKVRAPIVIGRDHLDSGSVASPNRETEGMRDGSDAVADWPILNALVNTAAGASWVSFHHGGGVGMGYSLHAGMVVVADGTPEAAARLDRVLTSDPGMGVARHADAGYDEAIGCARRTGLDLPMVD